MVSPPQPSSEGGQAQGRAERGHVWRRDECFLGLTLESLTNSHSGLAQDQTCWAAGSRVLAVREEGRLVLPLRNPRHSLPEPVAAAAAAHLGAACWQPHLGPTVLLSPTTEHPVTKHSAYFRGTSPAECQGTDRWRGKALGDAGKSVPMGRGKAEAWGAGWSSGSRPVSPKTPASPQVDHPAGRVGGKFPKGDRVLVPWRVGDIYLQDPFGRV